MKLRHRITEITFLNKKQKSYQFAVTSICSHLMAPKYWAESVSSKNPNAFLSTRCESYEAFLNQTCENPVTTSMGLYANLQSRGNFYLQTNMESPYSKD